jgi:hypothetical protein
MKQNSVKKWFIFLLIVGLFGVITFLLMRYQRKAPEVEVITEVPKIEERLVEEDWISFAYPRVVSDTSFVLEMDLLSSFETIEIQWSHPGNVESESYTLTSFQSKSDKAQYNISAVLGNLLPGDNQYQVLARKFSEQDEDEAQIVSFPLFLDISAWPELSSDSINFVDAPETTGSEDLEINGELEMNVDSMRVFSFYPKTGKASFTRLRKFGRGDKQFLYKASEKLENLYFGENRYVFEGLDEDGDVVVRKLLTLQSTRLTLSGQVEQRFGTFTEVKGGWFVSSALPWFSLRPAYEEVFYKTDERSVVVPRPSLQYSAESDKKTPLCEYLGSKDFEEEGVSYRAFSYEACQQYRFGVAVYDRFLSILTHQPVEVIDRLDYKNISEEASSSFLMIETGAMPEVREETIDLDSAEENFERDEKDNDESEEKEEKKRYYVFQMLLTEAVEYTDKRIGQIREEISEERKLAVEDIRELLTAHGGDRLFSELLFTGVDAVDERNKE